MPKLLKPKAAAKAVGKSEQTLAKWRCTKEVNLPYLKIGGGIFYREQDLIAFLESSRVDSEKAAQ
jgi:Helix-turn-helix domain